MAKIKDEQLAKINELKGKFNELTFLIGQNKINQTNLKVEEQEMFGELARLGTEEQSVLSEIQKAPPTQCPKCRSFNSELSGGVEWKDKEYEGSRFDGMPHQLKYKVTNYKL